MLAGSHRNAWPDETGTGGRTNRNTQGGYSSDGEVNSNQLIDVSIGNSEYLQ